MLLMDSSDVIINRDGSLKATKPGELHICVPASLILKFSIQNSLMFMLDQKLVWDHRSSGVLTAWGHLNSHHP